MSLQPTREEAIVLNRLRAEFAAARFPAVYRVTRRDLETVENYLQRAQKDSYERYCAAGQPDDWPDPLVTYCGPNFGPMFKNVELLEATQ